MNKLEFILALSEKLSVLPQEELEERLTFYSEMIDDRMDDGLSEEEAVAAVGAIDEIVVQIFTETPLSRLVKGRITPKKRLTAWEIVLLVLGSPLWLSLLIAAFAVFLSLYISLWAVIVSLWAVAVSVAISAMGSAVVGVFLILRNKALTGIAALGAGFFCAGLSIFLVFGCRAITKGSVLLTKKIAMWVKKHFARKEAV